MALAGMYKAVNVVEYHILSFHEDDETLLELEKMAREDFLFKRLTEKHPILKRVLACRRLHVYGGIPEVFPFAWTNTTLAIHHGLLNQAKLALLQKERFKVNFRYVASLQEKYRVWNDIQDCLCTAALNLHTFRDQNSVIQAVWQLLIHSHNERIDLAAPYGPLNTADL